MRVTWHGQKTYDTDMAGTESTWQWQGRDRQHMSDIASTPTVALHSKAHWYKHQTSAWFDWSLTKAMKNRVNYLRILSPAASHAHIDSFLQQTFARGILSEQPLLPQSGGFTAPQALPDALQHLWGDEGIQLQSNWTSTIPRASLHCFWFLGCGLCISPFSSKKLHSFF